MAGRLRAFMGLSEQKSPSKQETKTSYKQEKQTSKPEVPDSLKVPCSESAGESGEESVTPTSRSELEGLGVTPESPSANKKQLKRNETAKNLSAPENGTLKKKGSKSRLSPRLSSRKSAEQVKEYDDAEETLSESSGDDDFDDEQIIKAAIQAQDYEALEDFLSVDDLIVNEITSEGRRYLHECVVYDDQDACDIVLEAGGLINSRDLQGWTALHYAAAFGLTEMTQYLLDKGADPRKKSKEGETPEDVADDPDIIQKLQVARARRGLRSISTVSTSDIEAAQEEFKRRTERRKTQVQAS